MSTAVARRAESRGGARGEQGERGGRQGRAYAVSEGACAGLGEVN